jgi:pyruvate formate lyase activating enzyme
MGIIFDIQTYAVYDGPGIRTCVFFKGCPLSCAWCHNPESQRLRPEMGLVADRCAGCGACVRECPNDALTLHDGVVSRDAARCAACGACERACPNDAQVTIGYELSARVLAEKVIVDRPFFIESSGGVTLTGGEPTLQPEFLVETAALLREEAIHTAVETCGCFCPELATKLIDAVDLFLFDLKHVDGGAHERFTGVDNGLILDNFGRILRASGSGRIIPRIPLIPGFNADRASLEGICLFLKKVRYRGPVHVMPYNGLAKAKYERLGQGDRYRDMGELSDDVLADLMTLIGDFGFEGVVNH